MHSMFGRDAYKFTMIQHFSFTFFPLQRTFFDTPVTSSNLRNQALLFTELQLLQGTPTNDFQDLN